MKKDTIYFAVLLFVFFGAFYLIVIQSHQIATYSTMYDDCGSSSNRYYDELSECYRKIYIKSNSIQ